jgi:hypothetical protein
VPVLATSTLTVIPEFSEGAKGTESILFGTVVAMHQAVNIKMVFIS